MCNYVFVFLSKRKQSPLKVKLKPFLTKKKNPKQTKTQLKHLTILSGSLLTCNNPPDLVEGLRAGDARAATAAPSPSSAALPTERAWPGAGERQTWEESGPAAPGGTPLLRWTEAWAHGGGLNRGNARGARETRRTKQRVTQHLVIVGKIAEQRVRDRPAREGETSQAWSGCQWVDQRVWTGPCVRRSICVWIRAGKRNVWIVTEYKCKEQSSNF